jgi:Tfp pilus assembly protein PilX
MTDKPAYMMALHRQRGAALFMSLIFLLILTILGVFGMNISRMENLMAGNAQFQTSALNNAELAISTARNELQNALDDGLEFVDTGDFLYDSSGENDPEAKPVNPSALDWSKFDHGTITGDPNSKFIVEYVGCDVKLGNTVDDCNASCFDTQSCGYVFVITTQSETSRGAKRNVQQVFALTEGPGGS